jgi:deoxycytidylate deaminase
MSQASETADRPELIFALVGAAGVRLDVLSDALGKALATFGYQVMDIHLSTLLQKVTGWSGQQGASEFDRVRHLQTMGNDLRRRLRDGAALARAGIAEIRVKRATITGSQDLPASARAYIVRQLKHPDEVDVLRQVYGSSFLLVAGHAPRDMRIKELARQMARKDLKIGQELSLEGKAIDIITIDEKEDDEYGQNTRDTYPQADFFANLGFPFVENDVRRFAVETEVQRFADLVFGHPFRTPSPEEYAMYQASAASLRSSDENRQVGAAIVGLTNAVGGGRTADVVAVGMNEVPRGGGGFYWEKDSPDLRDQALGEDRAREIKVSALAELIDKIQQRGWLTESVRNEAPSNLARLLLEDIKRTQFMDIGEFSRPVHAEMAALIDAARRGVAVNGHTMYVTTFPCHNCVKHIIAAGLRRVVYLEPYPKSRASVLHGEEIILESSEGGEDERHVVFRTFSGIAPRQYRQLFSMSERGGRKGKLLKNWIENQRLLSPRYVIRNASLGYLAAERQELEKLPPEIYHYDKETAVPAAAAEKPA